ncbi:hypothetical protein GCM10007884_22090 [Methylobacterium brachythecii]|nr:hypothetical protein GCM10007884_22090 [Methylobacterium brachythecii]
MIPETDDEQKLCSDWTIWLEQADHNKIFPDKFVAWAMDQKFHLCRDEVRARRRHAKTFDGRSPIVKELKVQLSIRETKGGVSVMLNRQEFSISKNVFDEVLSMIERVASEGLLNSDGNSAAASRPVLKIFSDGS